MNAHVLRLAVDALRSMLPRAPLAVRVLVPDIGDDELMTVSTELTQVFRQVIEEFGIERDVDVEIVPRADDAEVVEVSADRRPVAIFPSPAIDWTATVSARTHSALLRRTRVLLDDAAVEKAGKQLPGTVEDGSSSAVRRTLEYLLDNGIGVRSLATASTWDEHLSACEAAERLINELAPRDLNLSVAESALRNTPNDERTRLVELRLALYNEFGIRLPDLTIAAHHLEPGEVRVQLNDVLAPSIAVNESATFPDVLTALQPTLVKQAAWLLRVEDVDAQRAELGSVIPDLVGLSKAQLPSWLLCACLRSLMANADSVRNLARIVWLLLESGPPRDGIDEVMLAKTAVDYLPAQGSDPESLASTVRRLVAYEAWAGGETPPDTPFVSIPTDWELALVRASDTGTIGKVEWRIARTVFTAGQPAVVVAHTVAGIGPLRHALRALPDPPRVIASQELPPDAPLPRVLKD